VRPLVDSVPKAILFSLVAILAQGCEPDAPETPTAAPVDENKAKLSAVKAVYDAFDYRTCRPATNCARTFSMRVGLDLGESGQNPLPNPRNVLSNPDPTWLPEWSRLPASDQGSHFAFEALTLAAIHKTFRAACEKAYGDLDRDLTSRLAALDKQIAEKNRDPNPYDRLAGLLAIEPEKPHKGAMNELVAGSDAVRDRWEGALFAAFEDTKRTFVYAFDGYAPSDELLAVMHPRQPKDYEMDAFCVAASEGKIAGVPALPDTSSWDAGVKSMVKRFVSDERAAAIAKRRAELADVTRAKYAKVKVPNPQLPPSVREITIAKVTAFSRDGRAATVSSVVTKEERVGPKTVKIDETATATFEDWPSGVTLETGDQVSFYGAELSAKELILKSTPELEHKSRTYQLEGKHVTKITNKGTTTKYFR